MLLKRFAMAKRTLHRALQARSLQDCERIVRRVAAEAVRFSIREDQIVRLLLRGFTNKAIATSLKISEKTVKNYMTILMQKLNARNRLEVVIAAQALTERELDSDRNSHWQQRQLS